MDAYSRAYANSLAVSKSGFYSQARQKKNYSSPRSYRSISLTSFMLKIMERIISGTIRNGISADELRFGQHAYVTGDLSTLHYIMLCTFWKGHSMRSYRLYTYRCTGCLQTLRKLPAMCIPTHLSSVCISLDSTEQ